MDAIDLEKLLGSGNADTFARARSSYPSRTPACPPTPRFYLGVRGGWNDDERKHVGNCEFCQRATALEWRIECPGLFALVRYSARGEEFEDLQAMKRHLEVDGCRRCALALRTSFVKGLGRLLKGAEQTVEEIRSQAEQAVLVYTQLPRLAPDGAHFLPMEAERRFEAASVSEPEGMNVTLSEDDSGELELAVEAGAGCERTVVEIVGERRTRVETLSLTEAGEHRVGVHSLGPLAQQVRELGEDCLVVVAPMGRDATSVEQ